MSALHAYGVRQGESAPAPSEMPSWVERHDGRYRLVIAVHPRCACTRVTLGEVERLMGVCGERLAVEVLVYRPDGAAPGWGVGPELERLCALPGVALRDDEDGSIAARLGMFTSGAVLLGTGEGRVAFAGGLTRGRGEAGPSTGSAAVAALVRGGVPPARSTPVYGCALRTPS